MLTSSRYPESVWVVLKEDRAPRVSAKISLSCWNRFIRAITEDRFIPRTRGKAIVIDIGDAPWENPEIVTDAHAWSEFVAEVKQGGHRHHKRVVERADVRL